MAVTRYSVNRGSVNSGDLAASGTLFAALNSESVATALLLSVSYTLAADATSASTATAQLSSGIRLEAGLTTVCATTAELATTIRLRTTADSRSVVAAILRGAAHPLAASPYSTQTIAAPLVTGIALQAASANSSHLTSSLSARVRLKATSLTTQTQEATLSSQIRMQCAFSHSSAVTARLRVGIPPIYDYELFTKPQRNTITVWSER